MSTSTSPQETSLQEPEVCDHCAGEHQGPCSIDKTLLALSSNLRDSFQGTTSWSLSDTTAGLFKVFNLHALNGATDTLINGVEVIDRNEIEEMLEWARWSDAAYEKDKQTLATNLELMNKDLVKMITNSGINKPAFFIGVHHSRKSVVMAIRGTGQKQDVFTDLDPHNKHFFEGSAHSGMLGAAKWLFDNEGQTLQSLLVKNLGYKLILIGHSLGAAIAGLLAMIIRATHGFFMPKERSGVPSTKILCWGFGCPPCVDRKLAESSNFICNVVLQDDIVPRFSPAAVEVLRNEILATDWSQIIPDENAKMVLERIENIHGSILSTGAQAGAALFQKIDSLHSAYVSKSSTCAVVSQPVEKGDISTTKHDAGQPSTGLAPESIVNDIPTTKDKAEASDTGIAAQTVMAVATGSSINMEELEKRRLFVPGILYHIKRLREGGMSLPASSGKPQVGEEAFKSLESKHVVVCGVDPKERFGRIVVSKTMILDHLCTRYIKGLSIALSSCLNF